MKMKSILLLSAILSSGLAIAQKSELKDAERAIKKGNITEAKAALSKVETLLAQATDDQKMQYYFLNGNVAFGELNANKNFDANLTIVQDSYNKLFDLDKTTASKYAKQAKEEMEQVGQKVINLGVEDNNSQNYKGATKRFTQAYELNSKDTIYLYYAASTAVNSKDFDTAIKHYNTLLALNFKGNESYYTAINKANDQVESFGSDSKTRDLMVKQGTHTTPKLVKEESKQPEIIKNLALIYYQEGNLDKAESLIGDARKANPDDMNLLMTQMDIYLKSNNMGKYEELAKEALSKNPNDDVMLYNLGVTSYQAGKFDAAADYYKKAIQVNPNSENAHLNLAILKLQPDEEISNKMNSLGMSSADLKKYNELKKQKDAMYMSVIPELKKVLEINPQNEEAKSTLIGIYRALEMTKELNALQ